MTAPYPSTARDERRARNARTQLVLARITAALLLVEGVLTVAGVIPGIAASPADRKGVFEMSIALGEIGCGVALLIERSRKWVAIGLAAVAFCVILGPRFITNPLRQWGEPFLLLGLTVWMLWLEPREQPGSRA